MEVHIRRYIFIEFEDLKKVKLKKLEKVCDKVFILINEREDSIPFALVQQIQRLGKAARWVAIPEMETENLNYHLCFLMGKLHQKVSKDIEFAILSNDGAFDSIVNYINAEGRSCLRVKRKRTKEEKEELFHQHIGGDGHAPDMGAYYPTNPISASVIDEDLIEATARDVVERLIRSGNRPMDIDMLRSYILLHNQELSEHGNVDMIIEKLQQNQEIKVNKSEVLYNF